LARGEGAGCIARSGWFEITEALRLWRDGVPTKRIAARLGLDPKTVRRDVGVTVETGVRREVGAIGEELLRDVLLALHPGGGRPRGDGWERCREQQDVEVRRVGNRQTLEFENWGNRPSRSDGYPHLAISPSRRSATHILLLRKRWNPRIRESADRGSENAEITSQPRLRKTQFLDSNPESNPAS
jgi:hypothetical protein